MVSSLLGGNISWNQLAIYFIGPVMGAIAAVLTYKVITSSREIPLLNKTSNKEVVK